MTWARWNGLNWIGLNWIGLNWIGYGEENGSENEMNILSEMERWKNCSVFWTGWRDVLANVKEKKSCVLLLDGREKITKKQWGGFTVTQHNNAHTYRVLLCYIHFTRVSLRINYEENSSKERERERDCTRKTDKTTTYIELRTTTHLLNDNGQSHINRNISFVVRTHFLLFLMSLQRLTPLTRDYQSDHRRHLTSVAVYFVQVA